MCYNAKGNKNWGYLNWQIETLDLLEISYIFYNYKIQVHCRTPEKFKSVFWISSFISLSFPNFQLFLVLLLKITTFLQILFGEIKKTHDPSPPEKISSITCPPPHSPVEKFHPQPPPKKKFWLRPWMKGVDNRCSLIKFNYFRHDTNVNSYSNPWRQLSKY
jgi:hypothetical protein